MEAEALQPTLSRLYDEDFAEWASEAARLLRSRRFAAVDVEHVAEEIEDMGKSQRNEVLNRSTVLLLHLLKWKLQPDKRSGSWRGTINTQRRELRRLLETSPSLRRPLRESLRELYADAVEDAVGETGLAANTFPARRPFSVEEILDRGFLPG